MGQDKVGESRTGRWPSLDGLRGFAVLSVIFIHAQVGIGLGGQLGVTAFFVLSGYLITSILLREYAATGHVNFRRFYTHRALRLLPAMTVMLLTVVVLTAAGLHNNAGPGTWPAVLYSELYISNWVVAEHIRLGLLVHTWSLSIEEQFYLVWPTLLIVMLRRRVSTTTLVAVIAAGFIASAIWMALSWRFVHDDYWVSTATQFHAQSLFAGCFAAVVGIRVGPRLNPAQRAVLSQLAVPCFLLMVMTMLFGISSNVEYGLGGRTVFSLCAAVLILGITLAPLPTIDRILQNVVLREIGVRSYGVYLWNWPLQHWVNSAMPHAINQVRLFPVMALNLGVAWLSYRYVERPFLRRKDRMPVPTTPVPLSTTGS